MANRYTRNFPRYSPPHLLRSGIIHIYTLTYIYTYIHIHSHTHTHIYIPTKPHKVLEVFEKEFANHPKNLWSINGKYYDLAAFAPNHPGGTDFVLSCRGTDATELFESHHLNQPKATALMQKYELPVKGNEELYRNIQVRNSTKATFKKNGYYDRVRSRMQLLYPEMSQRRQTPRYTAMMLIFLTVGVMFEVLLLTYPPTWSFQYFAIIFTVIVSHTVLGGYGHNFCHQAKSMGGRFLDWNGLSHSEWMLEHIQSHHMHTNSELDHDRHSMKPFIVWIPECNRSIFSSICSSVLIFVIFCIGELVVIINGTFIHRFRHKFPLSQIGASISPYLSPIRIVAPFVAHGLYGGIVPSTCVLLFSSIYFTTMAHCTHMSSEALAAGDLNYEKPTLSTGEAAVSPGEGIDWGITQLATSKDIAPIFQPFLTGVLGLSKEWSHCLSSALTVSFPAGSSSAYNLPYHSSLITPAVVLRKPPIPTVF